MNGKRHAVIVNAQGWFLGVNGVTWMEEYPNAVKLTPLQAKRLLAGKPAGSSAIAFYGEARQETLAKVP